MSKRTCWRVTQIKRKASQMQIKIKQNNNLIPSDATPIITDVMEEAEQLQGHLGGRDIDWLADKRPVDLKEERKVEEFACGCRLFNNQPCSLQFTREYFRSTRTNAASLSWNELNMSVMGQIMALTSCGSRTLTGPHHHQPRQRERAATTFLHQGLRICKTTFLFLNGIGDWRYKQIKAIYLTKGLVPREHGLTGHVPSHALVEQQVIT